MIPLWLIRWVLPLLAAGAAGGGAAHVYDAKQLAQCELARANDQKQHATEKAATLADVVGRLQKQQTALAAAQKARGTALAESHEWEERLRKTLKEQSSELTKCLDMPMPDDLVEQLRQLGGYSRHETASDYPRSDGAAGVLGGSGSVAGTGRIAATDHRVAGEDVEAVRRTDGLLSARDRTPE